MYSEVVVVAVLVLVSAIAADGVEVQLEASY